ncbi:MAG TPA: phosphate starvation-inducible protein PhoH [Elusimicrobia bacterium]|nr:phosphate starvation-inducible protein PhoH [Elusimicrobiota bacterium]
MKTFVLDTNVVIHDPEALFAFEGARVVIPLPVIEELDTFKRSNDERGRAARMVARTLDRLRQKGRLTEGVPLPHGGTLRVEMVHSDGLPAQFLSSSKDNMILGVAQYLKTKKETVIFISKDINLRIKAEAIGLDTQDYEKEKVNVDDLYGGFREASGSKEDIDLFYKEKRLSVDNLDLPDLKANEFVILKDPAGGSSSALSRFDPDSRSLLALTKADASPWGIKPLNMEQRFALELLLRKEVQLVTLVGVPGSGKTLLSLAAGLEQVLNEHAYRKLLIARPVVPVGHDLGYLPGTKQEKLNTWMGAIYDNLEFLMDRQHREDTDLDTQMLLEEGKLEVEAVTYLRGRSLPGQYILIDDAQNLTPHEIKTIISRVGRNSKIVLTGDPYQIDNYYLDSASNGLTNLVERFKGQHLFGHVKFSKIERSPLAALAAELL